MNGSGSPMSMAARPQVIFPNRVTLVRIMVISFV